MYLKLLALFILWSKIDTVRAILLSNCLLLPTSIHLLFSRFKAIACDRLAISLRPTSRDLGYH